VFSRKGKREWNFDFMCGLVTVALAWACNWMSWIECVVYDVIYLTAIEFTLGGSSTVHIYTQTVHRTTQSTQTIHRTTQFTN
jgi:hypothetical protein